MDINQAFGKVFNRTRKAANLTQEDFEPISPRTYISHLERGLSSITISKLDELTKVIGVHPASLVLLTYLEYDKNVSALDLIAKVMEDIKKAEC